MSNSNPKKSHELLVPEQLWSQKPETWVSAPGIRELISMKTIQNDRAKNSEQNDTFPSPVLLFFLEL